MKAHSLVLPTASNNFSLVGAISAWAVVVLLASGLIDLFGTLRFGGFSAQALLTVAYFASCLLFFVAVPRIETYLPAKHVPFLFFLIWAATSLAWTPSLTSGIQNVLVVCCLLVMCMVAEATVQLYPSFAYRIDRRLRLSVAVATLAYTASMVWFGSGTNELFGARTFSLFALFGVARQLARWRYGHRMGLFWAVLITVIIGASQSRLSLGIAVAMFPLSQIPTRRITSLFKTVGIAAVVAGSAVYSVFYFEPLRERFFTGDVSLRVGSLAINGSGRLAFWTASIDSFMESPLIGKGAGSAQYLVESVFVSMKHPHSDYVRILHDYGMIGLALWVVVIGTWTWSLLRSWFAADRAVLPDAPLQLTALLSLASFILQMTMENTLVYIFIAAPLGLVVGCAAGIHKFSKSAGIRSRTPAPISTGL